MLSQGKKVKILLVDSQASSFHEPLEAILETSSPEGEYIVQSTKEPLKALDLIGEKGIDVALLGLNLSVCGKYESTQQAEQIRDCLPEIEEEHIGYKLLRHIKQEIPETKAIILADYGLCGDEPEGERQCALKKGADGFLLKPFGMQELISEIERLIP